MKTKSDRVTITTDVSFPVWAELRHQAKLQRTTIRPFLTRMLEEFVNRVKLEEGARERDGSVDEVQEDVEEDDTGELYS